MQSERRASPYGTSSLVLMKGSVAHEVTNSNGSLQLYIMPQP